MFKETYGLSPETKLEKVVVPTAPPSSPSVFVGILLICTEMKICASEGSSHSKKMKISDLSDRFMQKSSSFCFRPYFVFCMKKLS